MADGTRAQRPAAGGATTPATGAPTGAPKPATEGPAGSPASVLRVRRRIDALDRRLVALMNERARLGLEAGAAKAASGRRAVLDPDREREVLLRVAMANPGPLPQADLLAIYRRLITATRRLEVAERQRARLRPAAATGPASGGPPTAGSAVGEEQHPG